jgi:DNA polymerase-3 subunit gamma/tau
LPTIRSRTQHYEFRLLGPELLGGLLSDVNERAGLGLDPTTLDRVVRRGNGSARDALSALDQAAAAGGAEDDTDPIPSIVDALAARDPRAALVAVAEAVGRGRDAHRLAVETVEHLRTVFLLTMAPEVAEVPDHHRPELEERGRRLGPAATVRAMEVLGEALVAMRDALDTRVTFEVALVRLCSPKADTSPAAMLERIEALEGRLSGSSPAPDHARSAPAPVEGASRRAPAAAVPGERASSQPPVAAAPGERASLEAPVASPPPPLSNRRATPSPAADAGPPPVRQGGAPRPTIGAMRQRTPPPDPVKVVAPGPSPAPATVVTPGPSNPVALTRDELTKVWGDRVLPSLANSTKSIYRQGRWTAVDGDTATFVLPNEMYRQRAEEKRGEVEQALAPYFGTKVIVRIDLDSGLSQPPRGNRPEPPPYDGPPPQDRDDVDEEVTSHEFALLEAAPDAPSSAEARLLDAFPGSEEISS